MKSKLLGPALLALAIAAPADAASYVQDFTVDNRFGGSFNPFDSSLGTLTRVTVLADVSDRRGAIAQFFDPSYVGTVGMSVAGAVASTLTGLIPYLGSSGPVVLSSAQPYISVTGVGTGLFAYEGDALSRFLRSDWGSDSISVSLDNGQFADVGYQLPSDFMGFMRNASDPAGLSIRHQVTYEYDAAALNLEAEGPVPEPASWAMMIIGFGVVGYTLRRSRRAGAATTSAV